MFQIGDTVMYSGEGACRIVDIGTPCVLGASKDKLYYILQPLFREGKIYTPVDGKVFMRHVISKESALELIDQIPSIQAEAFHTTSLRELNDHYRASFESHNCADLIEVIMNIYVKKTSIEEQGKRVGQTDERYMKRAEDLLYGEFSVALGIPKDEVQSYIQKRVSQLTDSVEKTENAV